MTTPTRNLPTTPSKPSRFMVAPPEVLRDVALRAQVMGRHGRIPVAPGYWSLLEPASTPSTELPRISDHAAPANTGICANSNGPLPDGEPSSVLGYELHSGRHRK